MNEIISKMALEKDLGNTLDYKDGLLVGSTLSDPQSILLYNNSPFRCKATYSMLHMYLGQSYNDRSLEH